MCCGPGDATICLDTANNDGPISITTQSWGGDDFEVQGDYLYIANSNSAGTGLSIADVTEPSQPVRVGFSAQASGVMARAVGVSGDRAFVGTQQWIDVLDISSPTAPVALTRSRVGGAADVIAEGNLCYSTYYGTAPSNPAGPLLIQRLIEAVACGTADFDNDGDSGTDADIEAFFACLAGNCCATCYAGGADFNSDGDSGTDADIESFFRVLAGGPC